MRIAVFTKNRSNPAYEAARLGAARAAADFGADLVHFVPDKGDDPQQQSALITQALAQHFDAFVLSPVHATRDDPALRQIPAAGIPLVSFVNPIQAAPSVSHVGSDDLALAQGIAGHLFDHLGGNGRVLVVSGPGDSFTSLERLRGFKAASQARPDITIAGIVAGDYLRETARLQAAQWVATHGRPDGILVANDIMAIGVLDALEAAGLQTAVVGVNAIPQAIRAIATGRMLATADFNAMQMAYLATECAVRHLRGEAPPANISLPVQIVHAGNGVLWDLPYEQRALVPLRDLKA